MKKITLQELIDAAEKNGYIWRGRGGELRWQDKDGIPTYCILDQAALNLEKDGKVPFGTTCWEGISSGLNKLNYMGLGTAIWMYNDDEATSYEDALNFMKKVLSSFDPETKISID